MDAAVRLHIAAAPADLATLATVLRGTLMTPDDPAFTAASQIWNEAHRATPMAIVRVANAGDVATTIEFARLNNIDIAVRSGGHSMAGHGSGDGSLVIDLRDLRGLHIDPAQRLAWAGAGLTAGEVTSAAAAHGLAVPFGDTGSVGLGGITLGGGIGWLVRKHGLTIDALLSVEIVTPDGDVLTASADENEDLFWAVRGGGGNFGVVTRFCYRLHPVDEVLGGALVLPLTAQVLRGIVPIAAEASDELSIIAMIMEAPPVPFVPADRHGEMSIMLTFVWAGDPDAGRDAIAPFRALAEPLGELVTPMPYPAIYEFTAEAGTPQASTIRSLFMPSLDEAAVDAVVDALTAGPAGSMVQLRVLGGAMARVPVDATAFAQRDAKVMLSIMNGIGDPLTAADAIAWNRRLFARLAPRASGVYANFLEDEGEARIRSAYPAGAFERLAAVKRRYDPTNVLHRNQNIRPAAVRRVERETGFEPAASTLGRSRSAN